MSTVYQNLYFNVEEEQKNTIKNTTIIFPVEGGSKLSAAHS